MNLFLQILTILAGIAGGVLLGEFIFQLLFYTVYHNRVVRAIRDNQLATFERIFSWPLCRRWINNEALGRLVLSQTYDVKPFLEIIILTAHKRDFVPILIRIACDQSNIPSAIWMMEGIHYDVNMKFKDNNESLLERVIENWPHHTALLCYLLQQPNLIISLNVLLEASETAFRLLIAHPQANLYAMDDHGRMLSTLLVSQGSKFVILRHHPRFDIDYENVHGITPLLQLCTVIHAYHSRRYGWELWVKPPRNYGACWRAVVVTLLLCNRRATPSTLPIEIVWHILHHWQLQDIARFACLKI